MVRVNQNDLVVLVHAVLVDPVGVKHPKITASAANTLLRYALQPALRLELVHTLVDRLAVGGTCIPKLISLVALNVSQEEG